MFLVQCWPFAAGDACAQTALDSLVQRCNSGTDYVACHELGRARARGDGGLPRDLMRALTYLEEACGAGVEGACRDYQTFNDTGELPPEAPVPTVIGRPSPVMQSPSPQAMVRLRGGTFLMGSPPGEPDRYMDELLHEVTISRDFLMSATEVTQDQYAALTGSNPSYFAACGGNCPVERVSWLDAVLYANLASSAEGLPACYDGFGNVVGGGSVYDCSGYRLPTEAEWEYAARAGTGGMLYGLLNSIGWTGQNSEARTHAVGMRAMNPWGLYDMIGNVWEWTHDRHGGYSGSRVIDPEGGASGTLRVLRGCSWYNDAVFCRLAYRSSGDPSDRSSGFGFRLARTFR